MKRKYKQTLRDSHIKDWKTADIKTNYINFDYKEKISIHIKGIVLVPHEIKTLNI